MAKNKKAVMLSEQLSLDLANPTGELVSSSALLKLVSDIDEKMEDGKKNGKAKSQLMDPRKQVVMSNGFVVGLEDGSRFAHKISRIAIAQIPMNADAMPLTTITAADIAEMGWTKQRLSGHLNQVVDEILSYRIKLATFDELHNKSKLTGINMFSQATVCPGQGAIMVQLNPILKEHFLGLKADYTHYSLPVVSKMQGYAASKLHELLLSRSRKYGTDMLRFRLEDLMTILNYKPGSKPRSGGQPEPAAEEKRHKPSTFINNVIKRAVENINEHTECTVYYVPLKTGGREYTEIRFYVDSSWDTREDKFAHLEWRNERQKSDPLAHKIFKDADDEIRERLRTGEGEVYLTGDDNYIICKVARGADGGCVGF